MSTTERGKNPPSRRQRNRNKEASKMSQHEQGMVSIGLAVDARRHITDVLNAQLADVMVVFSTCLQLHWNLQGRNFFSLHEFLDKTYHELLEQADAIAERTRSLGFPANASMSEYLRLATIKEHAPAIACVHCEPAASTLVDSLNHLITITRHRIDECEDQGDAGTADFLTGLMETWEKKAWMLRAYAS
eukprot:ANDGO_08457.mRNA.1 putative low temperature-induced protein all0458 homolog